MRRRADPSRTAPHIAQRAKWYGLQRWKRLRARILANGPLCSVCRRVLADAVDHVEHRLDNATFWDINNLRPICSPCNTRLAASNGGGAGRRSGKGFATSHGSTKTDTAGFKPDRAAEIFNRFKGGQNAKPNDE